MTAPMVVAGGSLTQRLEIREVFEHLSDQEKLYAHHLSRAAWYGTRVILRQVSPEAEDIFNLIFELHQSCSGAWEALIDSCDISKSDLEDFLEYAALFLANIGNYYVRYKVSDIMFDYAKSSRVREIKSSHRLSRNQRCASSEKLLREVKHCWKMWLRLWSPRALPVLDFLVQMLNQTTTPVQRF